MACPQFLLPQINVNLSLTNSCQTERMDKIEMTRITTEQLLRVLATSQNVGRGQSKYLLCKAALKMRRLELAKISPGDSAAIPLLRMIRHLEKSLEAHGKLVTKASR